METKAGGVLLIAPRNLDPILTKDARDIITTFTEKIWFEGQVNTGNP